MHWVTSAHLPQVSSSGSTEAQSMEGSLLGAGSSVSQGPLTGHRSRFSPSPFCREDHLGKLYWRGYQDLKGKRLPIFLPQMESLHIIIHHTTLLCFFLVSQFYSINLRLQPNLSNMQSRAKNRLLFLHEGVHLYGQLARGSCIELPMHFCQRSVGQVYSWTLSFVPWIPCLPFCNSTALTAKAVYKSANQAEVIFQFIFEINLVFGGPLYFHRNFTTSPLNFEGNGTEFITNARKSGATTVSPFGSDVKVLSEVVQRLQSHTFPLKCLRCGMLL